jgi:hypothetical protein
MARLCIDLDQMSSSGTESSPTSISFGRTSATCTERLAVDTKRNLAKKASSILWKKQIRRWAACGPTCRRRPRPDPPLIRAAVVPELVASLNPIDAGLLPPRRATDASQRHPQKCWLYTVKANGLWPTPRNSAASMHRRHTRVSGFISSYQRDHFLKTSGNQYRPQSQASHNLGIWHGPAARSVLPPRRPP